MNIAVTFTSVSIEADKHKGSGVQSEAANGRSSAYLVKHSHILPQRLRHAAAFKGVCSLMDSLRKSESRETHAGVMWRNG